MNQQEFYEHIAQNYHDIEQWCKEYIKTLTAENWDFANNTWQAETDDWSSFNDFVDVNFFTDGNSMSDKKQKPTMYATAYRVNEDGYTDTDTFVRICTVAHAKELV